MGVESALKLAVRIVGIALRTLAWGIETVWLGVVTLWRLARLVMRMRAVFSETMRCPRGHATPLWGVFECGSCQAAVEGYVFSRCRVCGASAGWTPCPECGLPVLNPLRM